MKTVLVVDDSRTIRTAVRWTLEGPEISVVERPDLDGAMAAMDAPRPDLVLVDLGLDGAVELVARLSGAGAPPMVGLAGPDVDGGAATRAGAVAIVAKPFKSQDLVNLARARLGLPPEASEPLTYAGRLAARRAAEAAAAQPAAPSSPPSFETPEPLSAPARAPSVPPARAPSVPPARAPSVPPARAPLPSFEAPSAPPPLFPPPSPMASSGAFQAPPPADRAPPSSFSPPSGFTPPPGSPFSAPSTEQRGPVSEFDLPIEEAEPIEDDQLEQVSRAGPSLEPPPPPAGHMAAPDVDVWSLTDVAGASDAPPRRPPPLDAAPSHEPPPRMPPPMQSRAERAAQPTVDVPPPAAPFVEAVADRGARALSEQVAVPGLDKEELRALAREVLEAVAWEVVPDLAETIIREEIARLTRPAGPQPSPETSSTAR